MFVLVNILCCCIGLWKVTTEINTHTIIPDILSNP